MLGEAGLPVGGTSAQKPSGMRGPGPDAVDDADPDEADADATETTDREEIDRVD
jgi:hypothetical protein